MDKTIEKFTNIMQLKLDKNKHKDCNIMNPHKHKNGRSWKNCTITWLLFRLRQETLELEEAYHNDALPEDITKEAADIANFAMMIADNIGGLSN